MSLIIQPVQNIPLINAGDHLGQILIDSLDTANIEIQDNDILVITQKIVSKAEGRFIKLEDIMPSQKSKELAEICEKDPRLVELILSESNEIVRCAKDTLIVEHRLGFICANAGVDHSNVKGNSSPTETWYLMLPENPDQSAQEIRTYFQKKKAVNIGVMIIDSHGRAWRQGIVGIMIGTAGVPALVDMRGKSDLFGFSLRITQIGAADELAAAASLMMGQADERIPVVQVRGFPYPLVDSSLPEVLRPKAKDLFR
jgi:coenzyme F420-0:L-glutamate ligase/coenzyme F420-1:gamma-L-glutamate ligase